MSDKRFVFRALQAVRFLFAVPFLVLATMAHAQNEPPVSDSVEQTNHFATDLSLRPPAVSEVNGKFGYAGGNMDSAEGHNFEGSITVPVAHQFGFQADGFYSRISDLDFYGGAGHFFWRDPSVSLVGITGGYLNRTLSCPAS